MPPDTLSPSAFSLILGIRYLAEQLLHTSPMSRVVLGRRRYPDLITTVPPTTLPPTTLPPEERRRRRKRKAAKKRSRRAR